MNELSSYGSDTPQRNRNNLPDLLRAMPVKVSREDENISNQTKGAILLPLLLIAPLNVDEMK